ncbi:hypothetical protein C922_01556 [Plasmodium inui San Antonio 1]|uniref:Uncharacterized protein n=1 Tax=Plasmodium inui San Antonio 1 TaxID=1237626 RepID=W7AFZ0_9APIC|nr:hypothetical protein C922_01556 [Plasmodium inui San Antonio 1]EUD67944.1 hypothetical protein C922_01556 [Plasmodium inui San Antonio 1]
MAENPNEEKETVRVTSSCWLSKRKISSLNRNKHKGKEDGSAGGIKIRVPNFNICLTSLSFPIIKLKNDLERISENKQIKRLRENRGGQKGRANGSSDRRGEATQEMCGTLENCHTRQGGPTNDDEVCSMLLRSKAFNETWRVMNNYMNCFVYNYVNEMVDREINFLNKNLCLRDDKVSLLIVRTQTCPFVNLLQYRALSQKLKEVNGCVEGVAPNGRRDRGRAAADGRRDREKGAHVGDEAEKEAPVDADEAATSPPDNTNTFTYKTIDNRVLTYTLLRKQRHVTSCIVNLYTHDSVESIIIRIIKKINRKCFMKIDKNNMKELFLKMVKKKKTVLIIFLKNYIKLKSSTFSGLLLYLLHLKEINSIDISVIITNNCVLSALSNLDYFVKKNVHVNICNLYLNYYHLIENIMFHPFFNNVLFKLKEYYPIIDHLYFLNHDMSFMQVKYFFYMFVRDFFDKKILSFLNAPLIYFSKLRKGRNNLHDPCPEGGEKYTKKFSTLKEEISNYLNQLHVGDLQQKFVLLLYASNFYEAHLNHLKWKGKHHTIYLMSEVCAGGEGSPNVGEKSHTGPIIPICEDPAEGQKTLPNEQNGPPPMKKRQIEEKPTTGKGKNKRELLTEEKNNHIRDKPLPTSKKLSKKRKIKNDFFYNCIRHLNFSKSDRGGNYQGEETNGGGRTMGGSAEKEGTVQNGVSPMWKHPKGKSDFPNRGVNESSYHRDHPKDEKISMHEIIQLMQRDSIRRTLKSSDHFRSCYFQNYVSRNNLAECLSPMNRIVNRDFMDDCNVVKVYVVNNLTEHMKGEHNFDGLEVLKKEWKNNEYWKIQQYESVLARMEGKIQNGKGKGSKKTAPLGRGGQRDNLGRNRNGQVDPQVALLYLHKCLAKSISKRMIALLYKKKKYNMCLSIINTILKNIPAYSSMRKRVHILKDLFKKYENKFFIYNVNDLTKANDEIEKEFKQMLNTICDILLNLYMGKINVLKKILNDISSFLESVKYVIKLEEYITEKDFSGLNLEMFVKKMNVLIVFFDFFINLKKKKCQDKITPHEYRRGNSNPDRGSPLGENNSYSPISTYCGEVKKMGTPLRCDGTYEMGEKGHQHRGITTVGDGSQNGNTQNVSDCFGTKKIHLDSFSQSELENNKVANLLSKMSESDMDLTLLEFVFIFFGEFFYFLLMPCVFLLPLVNTCIAHDHSPDAQDLLNRNLRMKILHVLYHNKLELKDLNNPSCTGWSKFSPYNEANNCVLEKSDRGGDPQDLGDQLAKRKGEGNILLPCDVLQNGSQMEDMVIMFHIVQKWNARHLNVCSMFVEYVNVKLSWIGEGGDGGDGGATIRSSRSNRHRSSTLQGSPRRGRTPAPDVTTLHCESFQELFYNFVIATMSLFYYLKIIHIPSTFVKGKEEAQVSPSFSCKDWASTSRDKENHMIRANADGDSPNGQRRQKGANVLSTSRGKPLHDLAEGAQPNSDEEIAKPPMAHVNGEADQKYKNYILDMLGSINIRRLIFGRGNQNTYSFDIINKNTWYSVAKEIFEATTPCNFTVIPSSYVNNSAAVGSSEDSVLLIRKKLKDTSESVEEGTGEGIITDSSSTSASGKESPAKESKLNFSTNFEGDDYEKLKNNLSLIDKSLREESASEANTKMEDDKVGGINHEEEITLQMPEEYMPQNISEVLIGAVEEDRSYSLNGDEPCDTYLKLGEIINGTNERTIEFSLQKNKVLCVHLEAIGGNGYLWALLGVHKEKPQINPEEFPRKKITKSFFTNEISVTQPKAIPKNKLNNGGEHSSNSGGYGKPHESERLGGFVGGRSTLQSMVKAHKAGTFFIVYSYYRPFDPTANANTKILQLTVS